MDSVSGMPAMFWDFDEVPDAVGDDHGRLGGRAGHQQGKLVAAVASDHVGLAPLRGEQAGDLLEGKVPHPVALGVVDLLEAVHVDQRDGDGVGAAVGELDPAAHGALKIGAVVEARQGVLLGRLQDVLQLAVEAQQSLAHGQELAAAGAMALRREVRPAAR